MNYLPCTHVVHASRVIQRDMLYVISTRRIPCASNKSITCQGSDTCTWQLMLHVTQDGTVARGALLVRVLAPTRFRAEMGMIRALDRENRAILARCRGLPF